MTRNARFCSSVCFRDARIQGVWQATEANDGVGFSPQTLRKYLLSRSTTCAICSTSSWNGAAVPLVMDHINGDAANDHLDNLRLICPNCDAQLPTFKSRNRGKGRALAKRALPRREVVLSEEPPVGLEPTASSLQEKRSSQLSYGGS